MLTIMSPYKFEDFHFSSLFPRSGLQSERARTLENFMSRAGIKMRQKAEALLVVKFGMWKACEFCDCVEGEKDFVVNREELEWHFRS